MFKLKMGDYEYIFEYDTKEEFEDYLKLTKATHEDMMKSLAEYDNTQNLLERQAKKDTGSRTNFRELEFKFVEAKKKAEKVSESTYKAYSSTFGKLFEYFKNRAIEDLDIDDYEKFREFLSDTQKLKNTTINNHFIYVNMFLDFAVGRKLIPENNVKAIESLKEEKVNKENFTDEDIKNIFAYEYNEPAVENSFLIAAYSGMRLEDIYYLTNDDIQKENDIYYFDIKDGKTKNSTRKVPIHLEILEKVLEMDFPLFPKKTKNATNKIVNRRLYKVIDENSTKSFHTFRATFIEKAVNAHPDKIAVVQEIVGHSKNDKDKLTVDTYAKGFKLEVKAPILNSVHYNLEG